MIPSSSVSSSVHYTADTHTVVQTPAQPARDLVSKLPQDVLFSLPLTCEEFLNLAKTNRVFLKLSSDMQCWENLLRTNYPVTIRNYFKKQMVGAKEFCRVHSLFFKSVVKGNFERYTGFLPDDAAAGIPVTRFMFDWKGDTFIFQHLETENRVNRLEWDLQTGFNEVSLFGYSEPLKVEEEVVYLSLPERESSAPYFVCSSGSKIFLVDPFTGEEVASLTVDYPEIYRVCLSQVEGTVYALICCRSEFTVSIQFFNFLDKTMITELPITAFDNFRMNLDTMHIYLNTNGRLFLCYMGLGHLEGVHIYDIETKSRLASLPDSIGEPKYFRDKTGKAYLALCSLTSRGHETKRKMVIWDTSTWLPVKTYDVADFQILSYDNEHYILGCIDCGPIQLAAGNTTVSAFRKLGLSIWKFSAEEPLITETDTFGWSISDSYQSIFEFEGNDYLLLSHLNSLNPGGKKVMVRVWDLSDGRLIADNNFIAPSNNALVDLLGIARKKGLPYLLGKKYSWFGNSELYVTGILGGSNKRKRESGSLNSPSSPPPKRTRGEIKSPS